MKKIVLLLATAAISVLGAFAQAYNDYSYPSNTQTTTINPFQVEAVVGANMSNWANSNGNAKWHPGFNLGVRGTYNFTPEDNTFYLNAALLLSLKGVKIDGTNFNQYYLELPVHVGYSGEVATGVNLFGEVGPYLGYGVFGKTEDVNTFDLFEKFDMGASTRVGVEFNHKFNVSVGFQYGFLKILDGIDFKNENLTLQLGYKF